MAVSKKGMRKIVVENETYYWKFTEKTIVTKEGLNGSLLHVDSGWFDIWLHRERPLPVPLTIIPKFVSEAIQFARLNNWGNHKMYLQYKDGNFSIKKKD